MGKTPYATVSVKWQSIGGQLDALNTTLSLAKGELEKLKATEMANDKTGVTVYKKSAVKNLDLIIERIEEIKSELDAKVAEQ